MKDLMYAFMWLSGKDHRDLLAPLPWMWGPFKEWRSVERLRWNLRRGLRWVAPDHYLLLPA